MLFLPEPEYFECKICIKDSGVSRPVHDRYTHFCIGLWPPYEWEFILDKRLASEDATAYGHFADETYGKTGWSLEVFVEWLRKRGYNVVWMRKLRTTEASESADPAFG